MFNKITQCYLCGNEDFTLISDHTRDSEFVGVIECRNCHLIQANSVAEDLNKWYETTFREDYQIVSVEEEIKGYQKDAEERLLRMQESLDISKRSLLDVGCGDGTLLKFAKDKFSTIAGIEPHQATLNKLRDDGFTMFSDISEVPPGNYNTVSLFHVLEHIPGPVSFLSKIGAQFPNGSLFIELPCITDALIQLYQVKEFMEFNWQAAHLFYFSYQTLEETIRKAGFSDYKITQISRYGLRNHLNWLVNKKPGEGKEFASIISDEIENQYCDELAKAGLSDTLWAEINM